MKPQSQSKNPWTSSQQPVLGKQTSLWNAEKTCKTAVLKPSKSDTS